MTRETEETAPEIAILSNEAALHALKRPQLVSLAKQFGIKASGKVGALLPSKMFD